MKYKDAKRVADEGRSAWRGDDEIRSYLSSIVKNKVPEIPLEL